jgi:hypothetical protein
MKPKPMLCKGSVVRAMLDGQQTQDRRPIKPQPAAVDGGVNAYDERTRLIVPPYQPGDIIWVRETHGYYNPGNPETGLPNREITEIIYPATDEVPDVAYDADDMLYDRPLPMRPSIHMPKWACRLFLKVNAVRVERVQDISIEDCMAEGIGGEGCEACGAPSVRELFHELWESLYPGSWERNEWVWVYEFERTEKPADWPNGG